MSIKDNRDNIVVQLFISEAFQVLNYLFCLCVCLCLSLTTVESQNDCMTDYYCCFISGKLNAKSQILPVSNFVGCMMLGYVVDTAGGNKCGQTQFERMP